MRVKLTQAVVDKAVSSKPPAKDYLLWDTRCPGFGIAIKGRSGCASFVVQYRGVLDGRSHRLVLGRCSKITLAVAREIAREKFGLIAAGRCPIEERRAYRSVPTFAEFITSYLTSDVWASKAPTTQAGDLGRINRYLLPSLGALRVTQITQDHVSALHRTLCSTGSAAALAGKSGSTRKARRGGAGCARSVVRLLSGLMQLAIRQKLISVNPCVGVEIGQDGKRSAIIAPEGYVRLWKALQNMQAHGGTAAVASDVISLLAITGARKSEVRLLKWKHVNLDTREIRLGIAEHKTGRKTGKERVIALSDAAIVILSTYQRGEPDSFVFLGERAGVPVDLARPWQKIKVAASLPASICIHSLRHGVGSMLGDAGMSELQIASVLGHSSTRTTQRYVHAGDAARSVLAQRASELVRPARLRAVA